MDYFDKIDYAARLRRKEMVLAIIPARLKTGDTIGIMEPSSPAPSLFSERGERGTHFCGRKVPLSLNVIVHTKIKLTGLLR
ncbi:hypothetical protein HNQ94_001034 [Salirhabdus euzebyi]|uniref:Uncharacterized protein n=1 Tax=Salirhabdus euzebyi TaxID=394506 RepID=A0A841PUP6_9BACI|nr:hypothetical protein [Salirhabdus euzebyi]MBB6452589.1 hypothetical protein [Salirhabdus euzebyi]